MTALDIPLDGGSTNGGGGNPIETLEDETIIAAAGQLDDNVDVFIAPFDLVIMDGFVNVTVLDGFAADIDIRRKSDNEDTIANMDGNASTGIQRPKLIETIALRTILKDDIIQIVAGGTTVRVNRLVLFVKKL